MDTEKLFKAIQIVVTEEVKKQISTLKEEIRKEILSEIKTAPHSSSTKKSLQTIVNESDDEFELAKKILTNGRTEQKQYSKNPIVNDILNETALKPGFSKIDGEWGELPVESMLGNRVSGRVSQQKEIPVSTGNDILDKAIARSAKVLAASKNKNR